MTSRVGLRVHFQPETPPDEFQRREELWREKASKIFQHAIEKGYFLLLSEMLNSGNFRYATTVQSPSIKSTDADFSRCSSSLAKKGEYLLAFRMAEKILDLDIRNLAFSTVVTSLVNRLGPLEILQFVDGIQCPYLVYIKGSIATSIVRILIDRQLQLPAGERNFSNAIAIANTNKRGDIRLPILYEICKSQINSGDLRGAAQTIDLMEGSYAFCNDQHNAIKDFAKELTKRGDLQGAVARVLRTSKESERRDILMEIAYILMPCMNYSHSAVKFGMTPPEVWDHSLFFLNLIMAYLRHHQKPDEAAAIAGMVEADAAAAREVSSEEIKQATRRRFLEFLHSFF